MKVGRGKEMRQEDVVNIHTTNKEAHILLAYIEETMVFLTGPIDESILELYEALRKKVTLS